MVVVDLLPPSALLNLRTLGLVARRGALAGLQPHNLIQLINTTLQSALKQVLRDLPQDCKKPDTAL